MPRPIRLDEFATALARCFPARARPVLAVANSAGPDSTCLLFLLRQIFPPAALLSLHVAHNLQPASSHMAAAAAANARSLGVPHETVHVPWGVPPFPAAPSAALERIARDARYNRLFDAMTRARVSLLALAHHADDQLETAIMRLARGSTPTGAAGMRPSRRWGMGADRGLAWVGSDGLDALVLRPLLSFPKARILATCDAHHLHYVNDPTNFQPQLTTRNAIRHCLSNDLPLSRSVAFPPFSLQKIDQAAAHLLSIASDSSDDRKRRLCSAVSKLATRAEHLDRQVTSHLAESPLPSPLGTLLLPSSRLLGITDPDVRFALVLRVLRYVSFHPWGSLRADADRRRTSVHRIIRALWSSDPQVKKFTAGAGVLWTPAIYNPNKSLRVGNQCLRAALQPDDYFCWLASRTPPFNKNPHHHGASSPTRLVMDLTDPLRAAVSAHHPLRVLYDCRFLLRIYPSRMPPHLKSALEKRDETISIKVLPYTQYYWPKVVLQRESFPDQILAAPQENSTLNQTKSPPWISIQWIRPLDAT